MKIFLTLPVLVGLISTPLFTMDYSQMNNENNINNYNLNNINLNNNMNNSISDGKSNIDSNDNINESNSNIDLGDNNINGNNINVNNIQISEQDIKKYKTKVKDLNNMINDCNKHVCELFCKGVIKINIALKNVAFKLNDIDSCRNKVIISFYKLNHRSLVNINELQNKIKDIMTLNCKEPDLQYLLSLSKKFDSITNQVMSDMYELNLQNKKVQSSNITDNIDFFSIEQNVYKILRKIANESNNINRDILVLKTISTDFFENFNTYAKTVKDYNKNIKSGISLNHKQKDEEEIYAYIEDILYDSSYVSHCASLINTIQRIENLPFYNEYALSILYSKFD